jgi:hypothetical protein
VVAGWLGADSRISVPDTRIKLRSSRCRDAISTLRVCPCHGAPAARQNAKASYPLIPVAPARPQHFGIFGHKTTSCLLDF